MPFAGVKLNDAVGTRGLRREPGANRGSRHQTDQPPGTQHTPTTALDRHRVAPSLLAPEDP